MDEPLHVIYVDDYPPMAEIISEVLEDHGFRVTAFADAQEALDACARPELGIALAVADFNMPGMDGEEFTRRVAQLHSIPVVVVSGHVDETRRERATVAGARAVLDKKDLTRTLPRLLQQIAASVR